MLIGNGHYLTYCTNIHPGESWEKNFENLKRYIPSVKKNVSPGQPFGIGLRLSASASAELFNENKLSDFKRWLDEQQLYVFSINGFPYGGFHKTSVKDQVHYPDWKSRERLLYTLKLINILNFLLPEGMEGSISTSPLSYRPWIESIEEKERVMNFSVLHLSECVAAMYFVKKKTGRLIHLDIEPEPDGLIENSEQVVDFFTCYLLPLGSEILMNKLEVARPKAAEIIREHIRICYDVCHFALAYEKPAEVFHRFRQYGIKTGKIQLSAALKADLPGDAGKREYIYNSFRQFSESTYLHQVIKRKKDGSLKSYPDLPEALEKTKADDSVEWRAHFHVPLFLKSYRGLESTQDEVITVLHLLQEEEGEQHLEVETYTWEVLPSALKKDLVSSITRELEWVRENYSSRSVVKKNLAAKN